MAGSTRLRSLITDPDQFFADRATRPSLKGPILLITGIFGLSIVQAYFVVAAFSIGEANLQRPMMLTLLISAVAGGASIYILWLLYAALLHGMSAFFDAHGSFRNTAILIGWGLFPLLLAGVISVIASGLAVPSVAATEMDEIVTVIDTHKTHPYVQMADALRIVFTVWAGMIWIFALKHARNISVKQAGTVVCVLVVAIVAWEISNLWPAIA